MATRTHPSLAWPWIVAASALVFTGCAKDDAVVAGHGSADVAVDTSAVDVPGGSTETQATPCQSVADCPVVTVPCQTAACIATVGCIKVFLPDNTVCDDGNACTSSDGCKQGVCLAGTPMDCDDGDPCTIDACSVASNGCRHDPAPDGTLCDDGNACSHGDACLAGQCNAGGNKCGCQNDSDCSKFEDGDECNGTLYCDKTQASAPTCKVNPATVVVCKSAFDDTCLKNACNPKDGTCAPTPVEDAEVKCDAKGVCSWTVRNDATAKPQVVPCDDGDGCTTPDLCKGGACVPGGNDVCGCKSNAECAGQDDGNLCNGTLFCNKAKAPAVCELNPATVVSCPSVNDTACRKNECNPQSGKCTFVDVNAKGACDDGNPCTQGEVCQGGQCGGVPNKCVCKTEADCAGQDDGDLCNGVPFCNLQTGVCDLNPATVVVCQTVDDTSCLKNQCNPKTGTCALTAVPDNQPCSDGNPCTTGEACSKGQCTVASGGNTCECQQDGDCAKFDDKDLCNGTLYCNKANGKCALNPATVVTCSKSFDSVCMQNQCSPAKGVCSLVPVNQGILCDDGVPCTKNETCDLGQCKSETDICECKSNADCQAKDDGDYCNGTMYCDKGSLPWSCEVNPASVVTCPSVDDTFCVQNQCQPKTGKCDLAPVHQGLGCNDGSQCTLNDACKNGQCIGTSLVCTDDQPCTLDSCDPITGCKNVATPALCNDDNPCTTDTCSALNGCSHAQGVGSCDDGSACTQGDVCIGLVCVGKAIDCNDGNPCTDDSCDAKSGCGHADNTASCSTGLACTPDGVCKAGTCTALPTPLFATNLGSAGAGLVPAIVLPRAGGQMLVVGSTALQGKGKRDVWLTRTDAFGAVQWQTTVGSTADELAMAATGTSDDGAVVAGGIDGDGYLVRVGPTGLAQWKQAVGGVGTDLLQGIATFGADELAAAGQKSGPNGSGSAMWLVRVSAVGTVLWEQTYPGDSGTAMALAPLPDGGFTLAGRLGSALKFSVARTDLAGKLLWQKTVGLDGSVAEAVVALPDGSILAGGNQGGTPATARLVRFAQDGTVAWDLLYGGNAAGSISALVLQSGGTVAVAGTQVQDDKTRHAWLLKVDLNGKEVWQRTLGVVPSFGSPSLAIGADGTPWLAEWVAAEAGSPEGIQLQRTDAWGYSTCTEEGECAGKKVSTCDDGNPCTNDACLSQLGCNHTVNTLPCDDGNACTQNDTCKEGQCAKGSSGSCDDGNPCTADDCDAKGGCIHTILTTACSDGDSCTKGDACTGGFCKPGPVDSCDDGNACTDDACDKLKGCGHVPNTATCSSGNCSYDDTCVGGFCKSSGKTGFVDAWYGGPFADNAHHVDQVGQDGYVITGETYETGNADGLIVRTDTSGKSLWQTKINGGNGTLHDYLNVTVPTPFGFLSAGSTDNCWSRAMLSRLDSNGVLQWTKLYSWPNYNTCGDSNAHKTRIQDMVYGNDGSWAATGWVHSYPFGNAQLQGWFTRFDKDGTMLSSKAYGSGATVLLGIVAAGGSGYFLAGYTNNATAGSNDGVVYRVDSDGDPSWSLKAGGKGDDLLNAVFSAPEGGCYAVGRTTSSGAGNQDLWLIRSDVAGKLLWEHTYGGAANDLGTDLVVTPGGPLVVSGYTWSQGAGGADATLLGVDASGNQQWQQVYGNASDDIAGSLVRLKSGGFALATYGTLPKVDAHDFHLLVTDAFGHPTCASAGGCFDKQPVDCQDAELCTLDACDKTAGCTHLPASYPCEDGNACTSLDLCVGGKCGPGGATSCDDSNPCTTDSCDKANGCGHDNAPDGTACGTGKACGAGVCK